MRGRMQAISMPDTCWFAWGWQCLRFSRRTPDGPIWSVGAVCSWDVETKCGGPLVEASVHDGAEFHGDAVFFQRDGGAKDWFADHRICNRTGSFVTGPAGTLQDVPAVQEAVDRGTGGDTAGGGEA